MYETSPYSQPLNPLFAKTSKEALWHMVVDLLAQETGHADDATTDEIRAGFIDRHETLYSACYIAKRLPAQIRQEN